MDLAVFKLDFMTAGLGHGNQIGKAMKAMFKVCTVMKDYIQTIELYIYIYIMIRNDSGTC